VGARMEWYIEQIFRELPFGIAIAMVVFLGVLLVIWLLLPLWVLFIQWNTGKIKDEIRNLADQLEKREWDGKGKEMAEPKD
jgi:cell division protein FtsL